MKALRNVDLVQPPAKGGGGYAEDMTEMDDSVFLQDDGEYCNDRVEKH
jgi:hypothetical protein